MGGGEEIYGGAGADVLNGGGGADELAGGRDNDTYIVDQAGDTVTGLADEGFDTVLVAGPIFVSGGKIETITVTGSAAAVIGSADAETITGGAGRDTFVFDGKASRKSNFDTVQNFNVRDDSVWLENAVFKGIGSGTAAKPGKMKAGAFWTGDKAHDRDDRILYNSKTGVLSYDADGTGRAAAVEIAKLAKGLKLTSADFFVI